MLLTNTMKKTIDKKKLDLRRERLRALDARELLAIVGGVSPPATRGGGYCTGGCDE
jgi:hypothetical protein